MIHFNNISFRNFLSVGDQPTIIQLDKTITSIVTGVNGAGKSTYIDALVYGLFGKPFRKVRLGQLINTVNEKGVKVVISFTIGKKNYIVKRGMKPSLFEIWVDNVMIDQPAKTADYQNVLENDILKLNYNSFTQIIVLGSASFEPFMQLKLGQRREVIEDFLDISVFSKMNKILKAKMKDLKDEIVDGTHEFEMVKGDHKTKISYLTEATENLKRRMSTTEKFITENLEKERLCGMDIDGYNEHIDEIENCMLSCEGYVDKIKTLTDEITAFEINIAADETRYDVVVKNIPIITDVKSKIVICKEAITDSDQIIKKIKVIREEIKFSKSIYKIDPDEKSDVITKIALSINSANTEKQKLKFYIENNDCPECKQAIDADFKRETIKSIEADVIEAESERVVFEKRLIEIKNDIKDVNTLDIQIKDCDSSIDKEKRNIDQKLNSIENMEGAIDTMEVLSEDKMNALKASIDRMKSVVYKMSEQRITVKEKHDEFLKLDEKLKKVNHDRELDLQKWNGYRDKGVELSKELEKLMSTPACSITQEDIDKLALSIKDRDSDIAKKKRMMHYFIIVQKLLKDDGLKTKIIRKFLPIINATVNMYLDKLDFPINFNFDENFNETIQSNFRNDFSYYSFSEGEKARIDLALLFTWREIALKKSRNATNIIIFDEIFDGSLDGAGIDNFMNILGMDEGHSSFIITHDEDVKTNEFDRNLDFTKNGHFSQMTET